MLTPLHIHIHLDGLIKESSTPMHLDGVVAALMTERNNGDWRNITLPFGLDGSIYQASAIHIERQGFVVLDRVRQYKWERYVDGIGHFLSGKPRQISIGSNQEKNYILNDKLTRSTRAEAWCIADKALLSDILCDLRYLGALRRLGIGRVRSVTITEDDAAKTRWQERILLNPPNQESYHPIYAGVRPPYWKKENHQMAWISHEIL